MRIPFSVTTSLPCCTTPDKSEVQVYFLVELLIRGIPPSTPYCSEYYIKLERNSTPAFIYHCAYGPMAVAGNQVCCQAGQVCFHYSSTAVSLARSSGCSAAMAAVGSGLCSSACPAGGHLGRPWHGAGAVQRTAQHRSQGTPQEPTVSPTSCSTHRGKSCVRNCERF